MSENQEEKLKEKVFAFIKNQPGYNEKEREDLKVFCENAETWGVTYGEDMQIGIAGFGNTTDAAYKDFVRSWNELQGFEWIKNNKDK